MHEMRLDNKPFELIKNGTKTIEMRLYDDKRRLLYVNDKIRFINRTTEEEIIAKIISLNVYKNFEELSEYYDESSLGFSPSVINKHYSKEEINKYGVVAIEIELI